MRNPSNALYPYRVKILHKNWSPGIQLWLRQEVGSNNFRYIKPPDAYTYLRYGFVNKEDALAFKLKFGHL